MNKKPVTAIIVGAGHRAMVYSKLALTNPELLKIVGVADPNPIRRKQCMEKFGFSEDMCFENADELAKKGKLADTILTVLWTNNILKLPFRFLIADMICFLKSLLQLMRRK